MIRICESSGLNPLRTIEINEIKIEKKFGQKPSNLIFALPIKKGSLAQLVQSICLTSRGSAVRTRQLPHKRLFHKIETAFFLCGHFIFYTPF